MSLQTQLKVQKLQAALHAKAKGSPSGRFYALYDKVYRADVLEEAYERCRKNGGAAGVDGQEFEDIEAYGVQKWLGELAQELRDKRYRPHAVRRVYIPKPDGKQRPLGIPTIRDRVAQMAAVRVLEPIFEADLQPEQYAYRANRNALEAVGKVHSLLSTGHTEVVDADLSGYFDSIPHAELMKSVARRVSDRHLLHLIKMWLEAPVEAIDDRGRHHRTTRNKDQRRGTDLAAAKQSLYATVCARVEDTRARGQAASIHRQLRRRLRDLLSRNGRASHGCDAGDDAQTAADGERGQDAAVSRLGRELRVSGIHHRAVLLAEDGEGLPWDQAVDEDDRAGVWRDQRADETTMGVHRQRGTSGENQPQARRLVELLPTRTGEQSLSSRGPTHGPKAATVVAQEAQGAGTGNDTLPGCIPVPEAELDSARSANAQLRVGESVRSCPKAGCGKIARPV